MSAILSQPQSAAGISTNMSSTSGAAATTTNIQHKPATAYQVGATAGKVQYAYSSTLSVTAASDQTIDLTALTDPQGNSITIAAWTDILIENLSTTTGEDFTVGGGTTPIFATEGEPIRAMGGHLKVSNPQGETVDSTHKLLKFSVAAGTDVQVKVTILGR